MAAVDPRFLAGGDPTGSDTFARYRYQAKLTLLQWLGTLLADGAVAVYAEHLEDILLEYEDHLVFMQVKTRSPGAGYWTADTVCSDGGGVDSLCRAYVVAKDTRCWFHLYLEGATSPSSATRDFIRDSSSASDSLRTKIKAMLAAAFGHEIGVELDDFLSRLKIVPNQPAQSDIDARCIRLLFRLLPSVAAGAIEELYNQLLQIVEGAQEALEPGLAPDAVSLDFLRAELDRLANTETPEADLAVAKRLTRVRLAQLLPSETAQAALLLVQRVLEDRPLTALEEKLLAAGANDGVVRDARSLRAMAEPRRLELLAGPETQSRQLEDVSNRVLLHARAVAQLCKTAGESADDLWARLVTDQALLDTDQSSLFNGDRHSLVGLLCCLSDECRFPWLAQ